MKPQIVFLDSSTVDFGDIDFSLLRELGTLKCYDTTAPDEAVERCMDADIVITNKVVFNADLISRCRRLMMIAEAATGYNNIDIVDAAQRGIHVANVPGYSTSSVAQLTMTMILVLSTSILKYNEASHDGTWSRSPVFTLGNWRFSDLEGKTAGIMGYGAIGSEVARLCRAFGMDVIALDRGDPHPGYVKRLGLHELAAASDFVCVHMPLSDYSRYIINSDFLNLMKLSAFLINMARGPIVEPSSLLWALENGIIAGAALDVMEKEPPDSDDPLLKAPNLIITPHIAWASGESRNRLVREISLNIKSFLDGGKRNSVMKI
ncbi:MAG TPA: D-2-hydroxyacid dehydrogenase [Spirochaetota bacterium]|nr:D-2-hydroxyacid dehydrogenase [Spirochaetota bacterium]